MRRWSRRADYTVCERMRGKVSSPDVSPFFRGAWRSFARTPPENASDKIRLRARAGRARPSMLSNRADRDQQTRSRPVVPVPEFLPLREGSTARDTALFATQLENELCKHASARFL